MRVVSRITVERSDDASFIRDAPFGHSLGLGEATYYRRAERYYLNHGDENPAYAHRRLEEHLQARLAGTLWTLDPIVTFKKGEGEAVLETLQRIAQNTEAARQLVLNGGVVYPESCLDYPDLD